MGMDFWSLGVGCESLKISPYFQFVLLPSAGVEDGTLSFLLLLP